MGVDLDRVRYQGTFLFVIYEDRYFLPRWFGHRFLRPVYVGTHTSNADLNDAVSLLSVLMEQTRFNYLRDKEQDLLRFSMEIWDPGEYDCAKSGYCDHRPPCRPALPARWRYTPQMTRSAATGATFAA